MRANHITHCTARPWRRKSASNQRIYISLLHTATQQLNHFYAKAIFVRSTRMQRFLKTISTLSCWYILESSHWVLSDESQYARVSVKKNQFFFASFVLTTLSYQQRKSWHRKDTIPFTQFNPWKDRYPLWRVICGFKKTLSITHAYIRVPCNLKVYLTWMAR